MLLPLKKIISMCVCERERENKEKQEGFFLNRETYIRIIVIDLIIVKLFGVYDTQNAMPIPSLLLVFLNS